MLGGGLGDEGEFRADGVFILALLAVYFEVLLEGRVLFEVVAVEGGAIEGHVLDDGGVGGRLEDGGVGVPLEELLLIL